MQSWRFWKSRPLLLAMILLAALGTLCLVVTGSVHGLRGHGPRRALMAQGVPSSLMLTNMTSAYAQSLCSARAKDLLQNQNWTDGPMCHFNASASVRIDTPQVKFPFSCRSYHLTHVPEAVDGSADRVAFLVFNIKPPPPPPTGSATCS